jgi:hypothetical protein
LHCLLQLLVFRGWLPLHALMQGRCLQDFLPDSSKKASFQLLALPLLSLMSPLLTGFSPGFYQEELFTAHAADAFR